MKQLRRFLLPPPGGFSAKGMVMSNESKVQALIETAKAAPAAAWAAASTGALTAAQAPAIDDKEICKQTKKNGEV